MSGVSNTDVETPAVGRRGLLASALGLGALAALPSQAQIGDGQPPPATESLTPFRVSVPQQALDDLRFRLGLTRWPRSQTVADWSQGVPLLKARALIDRWRNGYDWRRFEARLNDLPQFRTRIDGIGIHFIHVRSRHANALPIILTHGWPGSVIEFLDVIGPLTDPTAHGGQAEDAFDVVIPSLPGFAFSEAPPDPWDTTRIATAWGVLMQRLGYNRWVAQGGDWGSGVTHALGHVRPAGLIAAHVNWPLVFPAEAPAHPTPEELRAYAAAAKFGSDGFGYFSLQATRPETIGYALADSPVAQAAWIYEKVQAWTDNHGEPEDALSMDQVLDDISLYWFTNSGASSARIYWDNSRNGPSGFSAGSIELPMAATIFPKEIYRPPKAWAQALWPNLFYWNEVDRGGHFAAWEQPTLFSDEMRKAFRKVRAA